MLGMAIYGGAQVMGIDAYGLDDGFDRWCAAGCLADSGDAPFTDRDIGNATAPQACTAQQQIIDDPYAACRRGT